MGAMTTKADTADEQTFHRSVPETEPPVGTVASFYYRFASTAASSSGYMLRTPGGWTDSPERPARSWEEMVDLEARNAGIQQRTPGSTAVFVAVEVTIHATPPVDRVGDKARLVKLEHAVFCAAERLGIRTDVASHSELVAAIANLAEARS